MHQIATRPLTEHERSIVQVHAQTNFAAFGFLTVLLLVVPVVILLQLVGLAANSLSIVQLEALRLLAVAVPLIVYLAIIQSYWKRDRRRSQRAQQDLTDNVVQEIAVTPSRVCEVTNKSDHPALAFAIGDEKLLLLSGEWLYYANTYQAEAESGEVDPDRFNGLSGASGFPNTQFTVTRLPHSGYVLAIRVSGEYLDPSAEIAAAYNDDLFRHSEILAGSLEDLAAILSRERKPRK